MPDTAPRRSIRALILEDHDFQRQMAVQLLRTCGCGEILEAEDGAQAMRQIEAAPQPVELLLCDLNMPGMDGLAFLRHIAERQNKASVILASALDPAIIRAAEIMAKSYGVRILGVVEKPLSRAKLLPLILRHLSQGLTAPRLDPTPLPLAEIEAGIAAGEFEPFFQPKIEMRTCKMVGVEALMRWRSPGHGLVLPGAFIPVMEANNLISGVTFPLIEMALKHCKTWQDGGLNVPIAVNISVQSLSDTGLADRLEAMVATAGLTPDHLMLEITETVAMTDLGHALETLARCRMKGFNLSMDDYGTGFSSMRQLIRLPLGELKIDQDFVIGSARQDVLASLIETSVAMAQRLNLRTVAEGVETAEDWDTVARLGCDIAQGFFIARPMPAGELVDWYAGWLGKHGLSQP